MSTIVNPADNIYSQYSQWNQASAPAIFEAQTEEEFAKANEQAGLFDFQQGQNYFSSLHTLAVGEVRSADSNGNGSVGYNEYVEQGKNEYKGILSEETIQELENSQALLLNFWAKDVDINDEISVSDSELFYSIADESLPSETNKRMKNGKFSQEDLAQASETMLGTLEEENPQLEQELAQRRDYLDLLSFDLDEDGLVQKEEYMLNQEAMQDNGKTPEAKAGAFCVFDALDGAMGNGDGVLDDKELLTYVNNQYKKGLGAQDYYDYLLQENFVNENAPNHGYYQEVLGAYKNIA